MIVCVDVYSLYVIECHHERAYLLYTLLKTLWAGNTGSLSFIVFGCANFIEPNRNELRTLLSTF